MRYAFAFDVKNLARLGASRNLQLLIALQSRHIHLCAQHSLSHIDIQIQDNIILAPLEKLMRADVQHQEQTSVRPAIDAGSTLPIQTDLCASIHTRGNLHLLLDGLAFQAATMTGLTWRGDRFAATFTGWAGCGLNHLTQEGLAHLAYFTLSITRGATRWRSARFCT